MVWSLQPAWMRSSMTSHVASGTITVPTVQLPAMTFSVSKRDQMTGLLLLLDVVSRWPCWSWFWWWWWWWCGRNAGTIMDWGDHLVWNWPIFNRKRLTSLPLGVSCRRLKAASWIFRRTFPLHDSAFLRCQIVGEKKILTFNLRPLLPPNTIIFPICCSMASHCAIISHETDEPDVS